jgi:hypothetical protein
MGSAELHDICDERDGLPLSIPQRQELGYAPRGGMPLIHRHHLHLANGPVHQGPNRRSSREDAPLEAAGKCLDRGQLTEGSALL